MWVLVDAHHFYVSCERLFDPSLKTRPVVVLTGPQGCVVSCSREIKKTLGLKIGTPLFKIAPQLQRLNTALLRPNFALYSHLSSRMMHALKALCRDVHVYSIDEAFLYYPLDAHHCLEFWKEKAQSIAKRVYSETGIPVGVAAAPTKVLAKLAMQQVKSGNSYSKESIAIETGQQLDQLLQKSSTSDIWGIAKRCRNRLAKAQIYSALQLRDGSSIRKRFGVVIERIALELSGVSCTSLDSPASDQKQILASKSYAKRLYDLQQLQRALLQQLQRATSKARKLKLKAHICTFFASGGLFEDSNNPYIYAGFSLPLQSNDPIYIGQLLRNHLKAQLRQISKNHFVFYRVGVVLSELQSEQLLQNRLDLFAPTASEEAHDRHELYEAMDTICERFGKQAISLGPKSLYPKAQKLCESDLETVEKHLNPLVKKSEIDPGCWKRLPEVS